MECTTEMNVSKRILSAILLAAMLISVLPASALADSGFSAYVKAKKMEVYKDDDLDQFWGTLGQKTIVTVKSYSGGVAKISYNGKTGYADVSDMGRVDSIADEAETNCKTYVYEEPDTDSRSAKVKKGTDVYVLAVNGKWAMVERGGKTGYIKVADLDIEGKSSSRDDEEDLPDDEAFEEAVKEQLKDEKEDGKDKEDKEDKKESSMTVEQVFASGKYSNEELCYAYAVKVMGYNSAAAAGLLANIQAESGFRTNANGDSGRSYGICQWFSARRTRLLDWCALKGYDPASLYGQLQFLHYELETYYPKVDRYMKNVPDTAEGAYDAAYYFCYNFEAPANKASKSASRGSSAQNTYYPRYEAVTL